MKLATTITTIAAVAVSLVAPAFGQDKITFGTNWLAEAEHGGFYQAVVDGTYAKYGLDVKILAGGPQANNRLLLATGRIDFYMGANMIQAFTAVEQNVPTLAVSSLFQKDPIVLMSHPGQGFDRFDDLPKATAFVGKENLASVYQWLKLAYGFREENVKPYTFNPAPFLADKKSIQQGYVTSEPFEIERQGKFKPNVFLLADHGYDSYSTTIEARRETIDKNPALVQRFVDASIKEVIKTIFEAAILVLGVVFVFLQSWRATLIPIAAVPVSLIGTFAGLQLLGYSINTLTLFGMVLAIGIVVDDAIVVLENVERLMREQRMSSKAAAIEAMGEVSRAIIAIVLVLSAVFLPVAFLGGIEIGRAHV